MGQFGDKFRKAREAKELTLDDVSNVTKIGPRMLQAIEEENFDRLPGGVFNKGFIRAYAKHLGLDAEEAITEYLDCLRQAQVAAQQAWEPALPANARPEGAKRAMSPAKSSAPVVHKPAVPAAVSSTQAEPAQPQVEVEELPDLQLPREEDVRPVRKAFTPQPPSTSSWRLIVLAGLIFILGIALWTRRSHQGSPPASTQRSAPARSPSSSVPIATPGPTPVTNAPASATATSAMLLPSPATNPQPAKPNPMAAQAPDLSSTNVANRTTETREEKNDVTVRTFGNPAAARPSDTSAPSFTLIIRATENSWLSIVADGQPVRQETLIAPAHTSVHATREVVVKVGNAAGVSFLFNGKEISPQGNEAEPKTLVFDNSGLKTAP
ncbi:MAG TPA: RodZ domain-containing protein [Candidatus Sulfotelmatobacter sp.]|jgi:cytoskeleton protein RodZ